MQAGDGGFGGVTYPARVEFRCALIGLAGRPNVGKSTLVNAIVGQHVTITSNRPQTTRRRIAGIAHGEGWQLVLADLPGIQIPRDGLTQRMASSADLRATVLPGARVSVTSRRSTSFNPSTSRIGSSGLLWMMRPGPLSPAPSPRSTSLREIG